MYALHACIYVGTYLLYITPTFLICLAAPVLNKEVMYMHILRSNEPDILCRGIKFMKLEMRLHVGLCQWCIATPGLPGV